MEFTTAFERLRRFAGRVWLGGGVVCIVLAIVSSIYTEIFASSAVSATGEIVGLQPEANLQDGAMNYAPIFTFTANDGKIYTITSETATNPPGFEVGQAARVLYNKSNPAGARLSSFWQLWLVPLVLAFLGAFLTMAGTLLIWHELRRKRREVAVDL